MVGLAAANLSARDGRAAGRSFGRQALPAQTFAHLLGPALATTPTPFVPVASLRGRPVAWISRLTDGVTLLALDQSGLVLHLHSGTLDAGTSGWRYGPEVTTAEGGALLAAFNGGFKFTTGSGGFFAYGRSAVKIRDGVGSIVIYANGVTDVGAWGSEVPRAGSPVVAVRQNLSLLVDRGRPAADLSCLICWGATLGGVVDPARSALGITGAGRLIWAGGEHLTAGQLAAALIAGHAVRAVELDINPEWVAGYLYGHRGGRGPLAPVGIVAGQVGIPGAFLTPWSRDFFTVVAR